MGEPKLNRVTLTLCDLCLDGEGGECHTPGCALWIKRAPDLPLRTTPGVEIRSLHVRPGLLPLDRRPDGCNTCNVGQLRAALDGMFDNEEVYVRSEYMNFPVWGTERALWSGKTPVFAIDISVDDQ